MRYIIIDYMHLVHRCFSTNPLHALVNVNGEMKNIDTTVPTYSIKNVFNYSNRGEFFTGVCLEGGASIRKEYFSKGTEAYKGNRPRQNNAFYEGADLAVSLMGLGKVSLYRKEGYEADDLIYSLVQRIKSVDTTTPIDILTNDSDMLPLVDDQVSVYMRGNREYSEPGCPTRQLYFQVTPNSWDAYMSYSSHFRDYMIPYNSVLLFKMVRGDKSDNVPSSVKGYGAVKYSKLIDEMLDVELNFENTFRYGKDFDSEIRPVLENYFAEEEIDAMKFVYDGINLRELPVALPKQIDLGLLQEALAPLQIVLPKKQF